eukprot:2009587-Alexandrium_andersonii.AAC.1
MPRLTSASGCWGNLAFPGASCRPQSRPVQPCQGTCQVVPLCGTPVALRRARSTCGPCCLPRTARAQSSGG